MTDPTYHLVTGSRGGELEVLEAGDPDGPGLLFHGGHPTAAVPSPLLDHAARAAGLRLVTYSRPGYGDSTPHPDGGRPTVADDVADVAAVLDARGVGDFVTLGWSGGGPRALACAALLPDRCRAAGTIAGVAPPDAEGLDWFAGMSPDNVAEYTLSRTTPEAYRDFLETELAPMFAATPADLVAAMGSLLTPLDAAAAEGGLGDYLAAALHRAGRQGVVGGRDDGMILTRPWGFAVGDIDVPVSVWQGRQDAMVPYEHGAWLAAHVPGATAHLFEDEGHLTLVGRAVEMMVELRTLAGWGRPD